MSRAAGQSGVALITAILVVAIASIAAATILTSANIAIHRTALLQDTEKAWWVASGLESWVQSILERDVDKDMDYLGEEWAQPVDYLPLDEGHAKGGVVDLQGRFNLNSLAGANPEPAIKQFQRLLASIEGLQASERDLVDAIIDWIDANDEPRFPLGAEDILYLALDPPYRAANQVMTSPSELLAIQGMTKEIYTLLLPNVCVLPREVRTINVNTATVPVLMSLFETPDLQKIELFVADRQENPIANKTAISDRMGSQAETTVPVVASDYFQMRAEVFVGTARVSLYSLIHRSGKGAPVVLDRSTDE